MKLLLDQGLPRSTVSLLSKIGIESVHVGEMGMATAEDAEILAFAERHSRLVVTLDADFHALLARSGAAGPSVIRVRIEGLRAAGIADLLRDVLKICGEDLQKGSHGLRDGESRASPATPARAISRGNSIFTLFPFFPFPVQAIR